MTEARQRSGWVARMAEAARRWSLTRAARRVLRARPATPPRWPEPRTTGSAARGRRLLDGRVRVGAEAHEAPGLVPWDLAEDDPAAADIHAMGWLDDLAALGDARARNLAQDWVSDWVGRYGEGLGPGWEPALAARRLLRLLAQARFLLHPRGEGEAALADTVALHLALLERRVRRLAPGPDRLLALAAALQARLALGGRTPEAERLRDALGEAAAQVVDAGGGVATRSPEDLLETLALLAGAEEALKAAETPTDPRLGSALARAAPVLRALRHADGGLARFQGGGRGAEGLAEKVLSAAGRPSMGGSRGAPAAQMGYLRLAAGRTTVIVDAAPPPGGAASLRAHASTLALEITSGRRPLVVSCGPGEGFGPAWARATRATASHSTLALEQASSARLAPPKAGEGAPRLVEGPRRVILEATPPGPEGVRVELAQDGWRGRFGLTHARLLRLAPDGRTLDGEDMLTTLTTADAVLLDRSLEAAGGLGLPFALRFHLHPGVEAEARDGRVTARLPSGEVWHLAHDGGGTLSLEPSVYLEAGSLRPRETLQAVIAGRALGPTTKLRWTWAKSPDSPEGLRDLAPTDEEEDE